MNNSISAIDSTSFKPYYPGSDLIEEWLTINSQNYNGINSDDTDVVTLMDEVRAYTPYLLLEQILFFYGNGLKATVGLRCEYERYAQYYGRTSSICCDAPCQRSQPTPIQSSTLWTFTSVTLMTINLST